MTDSIKSSPLSVAEERHAGEVMNLVRYALENKTVRLAYQPIVQTARPDRVAFHEGLLRLMDPSGRIIPAKDFIDVVEDHEMGRVLDVLALEKGLESLIEQPGMRLSINMSALSIGYPAWNRVMNDALANAPTAVERLIIEITERTAITKARAVQVFMADLQQKGVSFALDDFGAGYTSLQYLRDFYFDILKLDGAFTKSIHENTDNQILVDALLTLAHNFDMLAVAENVETYQEAEYMMSVGIDCMQGYYFGAPTLSPDWKVYEAIDKAG